MPEKTGENPSKLSDEKAKKPSMEPENDSFLKIKQKTDEAIKESFDFAVSASKKIDKNIKEGIVHKFWKEKIIISRLQPWEIFRSVYKINIVYHRQLSYPGTCRQIPVGR